MKAKGFDEELIQHLQRIEAAEPVVMFEENLLLNFELPRKIEEITYDLNLERGEVSELLNRMVGDNKVLCVDEKRKLYYHQKSYEKLKKMIVEELKGYHQKNPTHISMPRQELLKKISRGLDKSF